MARHLIDRWAATTVFRFLLLVSALVVLPVLAAGVLTTVIGGAGVLLDRSSVDVAQAVFALLSAGGAIGFIGYVRAHRGVQKPDRHNVTATVVCLATGVLTALVVASFVLGALEAWYNPWDAGPSAAIPAGFAVANVVWALSGIAWIQRLARTYADKTGHVFDGLPAIFLFVAMMLATAAALATAGLGP